MTQDQAFLLAILENPEDLSSRLVYADFLEEKGDLLGPDFRCHGRFKVWPDGTVFWKLDSQRRTYLLGQLPGPVAPCSLCGSTSTVRVWDGPPWRCEVCPAPPEE